MWNWILATSMVAVVACGATPRKYETSLSAYDRVAYEPRSMDDGVEFEAESVLDLEAIVREVLARNPNIESARQAWRAALEVVPQRSALADPMLGVNVAPLSFFNSEIKIGFGVQLSQALPFPGKRRLRGEIALAEAEASAEEYRAVRERLALMAAELYYDYYIAARALEINAEHLTLLEEYGASITMHLEAGRARQDDALKIDVDLAEMRKARVDLEEHRDLLVARLNALLHRQPRATLPAPPAELAMASSPATDVAELIEEAAKRRPELRALGHRRRGVRASVDLADREYYPDFMATGTYNRMWPMLEHQIMVGLAVNLPFQRERRRAAVDEARARVSRVDAEESAILAEIASEVDRAQRRVLAADDAAALYRVKVLPAARDRVRAIRLGLDTGRTSFIEVIRAERELRSIELKLHSAAADSHRSRAALDWALGRTPGLAAEDRGAE